MEYSRKSKQSLHVSEASKAYLTFCAVLVIAGFIICASSCESSRSSRPVGIDSIICVNDHSGNLEQELLQSIGEMDINKLAFKRVGESEPESAGRFNYPMLSSDRRSIAFLKLRYGMNPETGQVDPAGGTFSQICVMGTNGGGVKDLSALQDALERNGIRTVLGWLPGDQEILASSSEGSIYAFDMEGKKRFFIGADCEIGAISPDGTQVAMISWIGARPDTDQAAHAISLFDIVGNDGSNKREILFSDRLVPGYLISLSGSPKTMCWLNNSLVAFVQFPEYPVASGGTEAIMTLDTESGAIQVLYQGLSGEELNDLTTSPDGRRLAFVIRVRKQGTLDATRDAYARQLAMLELETSHVDRTDGGEWLGWFLDW